MKGISRWSGARDRLQPSGRKMALLAFVAAVGGFYLVTGVLGAVRAAMIVPPSGSQGSPLVRCEPASITGEVTDTLTVDFYVQDVAGLYGADLELSFDVTIGQVVDEDPATPGVQIQPLSAFLKPDFILFQDADNTTGNVHYALTQLNPSEPATGSGSLARFRLQALRSGSLTMRFTRHDLSSREGVPIANETQSCSVRFGEPLPIETATSTPTSTETASPTPDKTATATPTEEPVASLTPTASATPTETLTPKPTPSSTPTATATATASPTPSRTPTSTPTPTRTATATLTATATSSATVPPTGTPTTTSTMTPTSTPSRTWTPTATATPTASPDHTPTPTPSPEPTPSATPSPEPTASATSTASPTATADPTPTPTVAPVTIDAYVFLDLDQDGGRDEGESGIGGVMLLVQRDTDGRNWSGVTDAQGFYRFAGLSAGSTYAIKEFDLPGYVSTTANLAFMPIPLDGAGQTFIVLFGDRQIMSGRLYLPLVLN